MFSIFHKSANPNTKVIDSKPLSPAAPPKGYKWVKTQNGWILKKI